MSVSTADTHVTPIPSLAEFRARMADVFLFQDAIGGELQVALVDAYEQPAMNKRYVCYGVQFALPPGASLTQGLYTVRSGEDSWAWLLTPVLTGDDGRARMEAVFHLLSQTAPDANRGQQNGRSASPA